MTSSYPLFVTHQNGKCQMIVKYIAVKCDYSKIFKQIEKDKHAILILITAQKENI